MKVQYTLTKEEDEKIQQVFEDIPTNLCNYVRCPDCEGDACENCPLRSISDKWERGLSELCEHINDLLKPIQPREEN